MERYHYRLLAGFDDRCEDEDICRKYLEFMEKYNAVGIGDKRTRDSELCFFSERELTQKDLEAELGEEIPITQFIRVVK